MVDLDQGGTPFQKTRTYLGPSLGWVDTQVLPSKLITTAGTYQVQPGDSTIFIAVASGAVTILLPNVMAWVQESAYQPATGFARLITIKDLGHAAGNPITIQPFGSQTVDGQVMVLSITQDFQSIGLLPDDDLGGWWRQNISTVVSGSGNMVLPVNPVPSRWISSIDVGGNASLTQPAFTDISGTLQVNKGGTGITAGVTNGVPYYNSATTMTQTSAGGPGTIMKGNPPDFVTNPTLGTVGTEGSVNLVGSSSGSVKLSPSVSGSVWILRFPPNGGSSGQVLQTDGAGNTVWATPSGGGGGGIPEAPTDGKVYGRQNATWSDIGLNYQPLDGDLTAIAGLSGINVIYYRSAANTWTGVTIGAGLNFTGGVLTATSGGGNVSNVGTPVSGQWAQWTGVTTIQGIDTTAMPFIQKSGDTMTGLLTLSGNPSTALQAAPKQYVDTNFQPLDADLTSLAAASATNAIYYRSAANTWATVTVGTGLSFSAGTLTNTVSIAGLAPLASPVFTGDPQAPTPATADNDTSIATTAYVKANLGGMQPLDADLTAIAALTGTNVIYYRSAADTWTPVTIGTGLAFGGSVLSCTVTGGGNVNSSGTPTVNQFAQWTDATHIQGVAAASMPFVQKAGDTMTGNLGISKTNPQMQLIKGVSGESNTIVGYTGANLRWQLTLGGTAAESGSNVGSDFNVSRYNDAGTFVDSPIVIARNTGLMLLTADPTAALGAATKQYVDAAAPALGNWKMEYTNGSGVRTAVALSAAGTTLVSTGATAAPTMQAVLQPGVTNTITVGYTFTAFSLGSPITSFTVNAANGNYQFGNNNAAFTITAPTADCAVDIMVTNLASAGAITFSGFTVGANVGDPLTTTNGNKFIISIRRIAGTSTYTIKALQ